MINRSSGALVGLRAADRPARTAGSTRTLTLVAADLAAFAIASTLVMAWYVGHGGPAPFGLADSATLEAADWQGWGTLAVLAGLLVILGLRGRYTARVAFWPDLGRTAAAVGVALLADSFIRAELYGAPPAAEDLVRWMLFLPCMTLLRIAARVALQSRGLWSVRTLIVGEGSAVAGARAALSSQPGLGYEVIGAIDLQRAVSHRLGLGGAAALQALGADYVVLAMGGGDPAAENAVAAALARTRVPFGLVPALDGVPVSGVAKQYFMSHDVMLLTCGNNLARPACRMLKGLFDQGAAALAVLLLSPLFLVLCALIRLDGGPAFFGHGRIGERGQRFRCLKFRSMSVDSERILRELLERDPAARREWASTQKLRDDPRVTPIGRVLRKTSLDELPQLLNVLRGEMSLVGPRPIVDAEVSRYGDKIGFYYEAKPGITGLWQVSGRSNTSYEHRVKLDVWYVRNWTLLHDVAILLKTVPAVLLKHGAV